MCNSVWPAKPQGANHQRLSSFICLFYLQHGLAFSYMLACQSFLHMQIGRFLWFLQFRLLWLTLAFHCRCAYHAWHKSHWITTYSGWDFVSFAWYFDLQFWQFWSSRDVNHGSFYCSSFRSHSLLYLFLNCLSLRQISLYKSLNSIYGFAAWALWFLPMFYSHVFCAGMPFDIASLPNLTVFILFLCSLWIGHYGWLNWFWGICSKMQLCLAILWTFCEQLLLGNSWLHVFYYLSFLFSFAISDAKSDTCQKPWLTGVNTPSLPLPSTSLSCCFSSQGGNGGLSTTLGWIGSTQAAVGCYVSTQSAFG